MILIENCSFSARDCGIPPPVDHAVVSYGTTTFNSSAIYSCSMGYWISRNHDVTQVTCAGDGTWKDVPKACKGKGQTI